MEYHFTGTGGSPDFTFIADGIIDGTGKFIFYTAIIEYKGDTKGRKGSANNHHSRKRYKRAVRLFGRRGKMRLPLKAARFSNNWESFPK